MNDADYRSVPSLRGQLSQLVEAARAFADDIEILKETFEKIDDRYKPALVRVVKEVMRHRGFKE